MVNFAHRLFNNCRLHKITDKIIPDGQVAMRNAAVYRKGNTIISKEYYTLRK